MKYIPHTSSPLSPQIPYPSLSNLTLVLCHFNFWNLVSVFLSSPTYRGRCHLLDGIHLTIKYKEIIMNIMYAIGNVTGKTTKLIWGATTTTTGSAVRGFKDAFKSPTIITPNDDLEPVTINPQPTTYRQSEMNI